MNTRSLLIGKLPSVVPGVYSIKTNEEQKFSQVFVVLTQH